MTLMARDLAEAASPLASRTGLVDGQAPGVIGSAVAERLGDYRPVELAALLQERLEGSAVRGGQHADPMITRANGDLPGVALGSVPAEQDEDLAEIGGGLDCLSPRGSSSCSAPGSSTTAAPGWERSPSIIRGSLVFPRSRFRPVFWNKSLTWRVTLAPCVRSPRTRSRSWRHFAPKSPSHSLTRASTSSRRSSSRLRHRDSHILQDSLEIHSSDKCAAPTVARSSRLAGADVLQTMTPAASKLDMTRTNATVLPSGGALVPRISHVDGLTLLQRACELT